MLVSLGPRSNHLKLQGKKVSDSPGRVDFAIGLVNSYFQHLPSLHPLKD